MINQSKYSPFIVRLLKYQFSVRVRYAPSPTGPLHLGAIRTALFNYLYAKKHQGKFIVRVQDTDQERNVEGSINDIFSNLEWLGIKPDESINTPDENYQPYIQSQRLELYSSISKALLKSGYAYPCFCESPGGKKQHSKGEEQYWYDKTCRKLKFQQIKERIKGGQEYAIRIKSDIPEFQVDQFHDQIYGLVTASKFDDFIIVKRNGWPTFHFANVIDDWKMKITHVIRGQQWLTNTSKHLYLYKMLAKQPPIFMHLPLILSADGKKLSKRDPTSPINQLKEKGYLPESIINFVGLLGFAPQIEGKDEFFSLSNLQQIFSENQIKKMPIRSQLKKLNHINKHYIRQKWLKNDPSFQEKMCSKMRQYHKISQSVSNEDIKLVLNCIIERISNFQDLKSYGYFFNAPNFQNSETGKDIQKIFGTGSGLKNGKILVGSGEKYEKNKKILHNLRLIFQHIIAPENYSEIEIAKKISQFLFDNKNEVTNEQTYHLLRLAMSGRKSGPNIIKTCEIVGKEEAINRLRSFAQMC